jgi:tripartite ATP-independent transporter DctP family solute receptor
MKTRTLLMSLVLSVASLIAAHPARATTITIKFAHNMPPRPDANYHLYYLRFKELAEKYTNGAVEFREFPASQMGTDQQAAKKLQLGTIEMMNIASNNLAQLYSGFDLFTLPFLIKSIDCGVNHVLSDNKLLADISEGAQKQANIRVLAFTISGMRNMMNSKHAIMTPADLKGMRMRVAKNPILLDTYKSLGADVVGVASAETYGALQTGIVDGNDGGSSWAYSQKLYEVQKYYSITGHQLVVNSVIINNKFFEGLPKDVQAGLERAALEAAKSNMVWMEGFEQKIYDHFQKAGLKIDHPNLDAFRDAVQPVWKKYADRVGGWERIKHVEQLEAQCK